MSIFEENMNCLGEKNLGLKTYIESKLKEIKPTQINTELCRNRVEGLNIKIREGNKEYFIHSNYNPDAEAEKWVANVDTDADIIVVFGLGLGYHIEKLVGFLKKDAKIYIVEPNMEIFKLFLENISLNNGFLVNATFIVGEIPERVAEQIFMDFKSTLLGKVDFVAYSIYKNLYGSQYEAMKNKFVEFVKVLTVNISTSEYFKWLWLSNYLMNILNMDGVINGKHLSNIFSHKPAIIVSAGPSLNKNIGLLKLAENKAVIFAAGSSYRILKNYDITPDFTAVIDGSPLIKDIYNGLDAKDTALIFINRAFHEVVQAFHKNKVIFIDSEDRLTQYFSEKMSIDFEIIAPDQTVAGTCVSLASYMGCNPIIFVGQDFACTGLEFHADGAAHMFNFKDELENNPNGLIKMKDIYDQETYTLSSLLSSKISMETKVNDAIKNGHKFINATEGGIGVNNCENLDFKEVLEKHINDSIDISALLNQIFSNNDCHIKINNKLLCEYFEYIKAEASVVKSKAIELNELCMSAKRELSRKDFRPHKYSAIAKKVNIKQNQVEKNNFYNKIILASLTQSIAIHKIVMENDIRKSSDIIKDNLVRIEFISKQMAEIAEMCVFLETFIEKVYEPIYKKSLNC